MILMLHLFGIDPTVNYPCHLLFNSFGLFPFPETGEGEKKNTRKCFIKSLVICSK